MTCRVVICRPQPGAGETARRARKLGMTPVTYPLFAIEPLDWTPPPVADFDAVMLTSANAPRQAGRAMADYAGLPAFATGDATAREAVARGFANVTIAPPDARSVAEAIARAGHSRVLHLCGKDVRDVAADALHITRIPVYHATEAGDAAGLEAVLTAGSIILVHSPRAGARVDTLVGLENRATLAIVAISPAALNAAGTGWARGEAAGIPGDAAMLALAGQICQEGVVTPSQAG